MSVHDETPPARHAAAEGKAAVDDAQSLPMFEGAASRRHALVSLPRLRRRAALGMLKQPLALRRCATFVQFAGFPRSGHSLVGALLDAHPGAVIAHELDAMGLIRKGLSRRAILHLCQMNAADFARDGRWWNGFCYDVKGAPEASRRPRVIGDKKGDWAMRWCAADSTLIDALQPRMAMPCKWIMIVRHPFDNVATMSLRLGRVYDRLRIAHQGDLGALRDAITSAQKSGEIASAVDDAMVTDYRALAATVAEVKARVAPENWHEISYEAFVGDPGFHLRTLARFLNLDAPDAWVTASMAMMAPRASRSRSKLTWREDQKAALIRTTYQHDFLKDYRDDA